MNKINNISFGEIILSERLKNTMIKNQQNLDELKRYTLHKPDCYIDLCFTKKGDFYLRATETDNFLKNTVTERLWLDGRQSPYISDILKIYDKFQKEIERKIQKIL